MKLKALKSIYRIRRERIRKRLEQFRKYYVDRVEWSFQNNKLVLIPSTRDDNERLFLELCFCLLTANTSALMSLRAVEKIKEKVMNASLNEISSLLKSSGYRFYNKRAEYIVYSRKYSKTLKELIERHKHDRVNLREFLVRNIKGFSYKEASHFLRNIGFFSYAILDKHILSSLYELRVIGHIPKTLNKKLYEEIEKKYMEFSKKIEIDAQELDLLLWSIKNGDILK